MPHTIYLLKVLKKNILDPMGYPKHIEWDGIDIRNPLDKYYDDSLEVMDELSKIKNESVKLQKND